MTLTLKGKGDFDRFVRELVPKLEANVLRGAIGAGCKVIAERARELTVDPDVAASIKVSTSVEPGRVTGSIRVTNYRGAWGEFGTAPHLITADDDVREGKTVRRLNDQVLRGELVIDGRFVGHSIHHPGARPHPYLRPAVDSEEDNAIRATGDYIARRATREGLDAPPPPDEPE